VLSTDELQTFVLPANAPVGRFLRICLHGKRQRQLEDLNFYAAMRCAYDRWSSCTMRRPPHLQHHTQLC